MQPWSTACSRRHSLWRPLLAQPSNHRMLVPTAALHRSSRAALLSPAPAPAPAASPSTSSSPPFAPPSAVSAVSGGSAFKVFNVSLDSRKPLSLALRGVYGIGAHTARSVCGALGCNPHTPLSELSASFHRIKAHVESHFQPRHIVEKQLAARILDKVRIGSYQGIRHTQCLPVRGQRTQTNARTQRKLGRQRMIAYNIPAFNKKKPSAAGVKPQLATLAQQHAQQQQSALSASKQGQKKG